MLLWRSQALDRPHRRNIVSSNTLINNILKKNNLHITIIIKKKKVHVLCMTQLENNHLTSPNIKFQDLFMIKRRDQRKDKIRNNLKIYTNKQERKWNKVSNINSNNKKNIKMSKTMKMKRIKYKNSLRLTNKMIINQMQLVKAQVFQGFRWAQEEIEKDKLERYLD